MISSICYFTPSALAAGGEHTNNNGNISGPITAAGFHWKLGDWDATTGGVNNALSAMGASDPYKQVATGYNINAAIESCKSNNAADGHGYVCPDARLVAIGVATDSGGHALTSFDCLRLFPSPDFGSATNTTVQGNIISTGSSLGKGGSIYDLSTANLTCNTINKLVVISSYQYQQKGWYPHWVPVDRVDVASANQIKTEKLDGCPVYYMMYAYGIDGYVKDQTVEPQKYQTPYGKLWDSVKTGGTWIDENGVRYGPFTGDWANQDQKVAELKKAKEQACGETYRMKITYDLGAGKKVYLPGDKLTQNKDTGEILSPTAGTDGSTAKTTDYNKDGKNDSKDFTVRFAKGGIYKVVKSEKIATLVVKTTEVKYYRRDSAFVKWDGWRKCKKGDPIDKNKMGLGKIGYKAGYTNWNGNVCGHIGEANKPYNNGWPGLNLDPYDGSGWGFWNGNYGSSDGWAEDSKVEGAVNGDRKVNGNNISALFNRGYVTKFNCDGVTVTITEIGNENHIRSDNCKPIEWNFQNDALGWNKPNGIAWSPGGKDAWKSGSARISGAISTLNGQLHPVSNAQQSYVTVSFKDYMHVNCNKLDFDKYVANIPDTYVGYDGGTYSVLNAKNGNDTAYHTSGKFSGDLITAEIPVSDQGGGDEPLLRALDNLGGARYDSTHTGAPAAGRAAELRGIQVSSPGTTATKAEEIVSNYNTGYFNGDGTIKDPFYTKECPYDCSDTDTTGTSAIKNIRDTNATAEQKADFNDGIKVNTADMKGYVSSDWTNNAIMTFFRTNADNQFTVDVWHPTNQDSITWDGAAAKTTTITSNHANTPSAGDNVAQNGTPWLSRDGTFKMTDFGVKGGKRKMFQNGPLDSENVPSNLSRLDSKVIAFAWVETLAGQQNTFLVKSPWASDNGKPLQFNIKWEYETQNKVRVPSAITATSGGDSNEAKGSTSSVNLVDVSVPVDGHCYGQTLNKGGRDTTVAFHDNTGYNSNNDLDKGFRDYQDTKYPFGKFVIQFVRSTAE